VLQRGDRILRLEKRPMELLILLVEKRGELVSREEAARRLWGSNVFVDVDHGIKAAFYRNDRWKGLPVLRSGDVQK
jgi:DNA-binding winged helix-turn-helix (wHTH) protein